MKPSWDEAPEWAKWLAMDADGDWYWYLNEPKVEYPSDDYWTNFGPYAKAGYTPNLLDQTLEKRP